MIKKTIVLQLMPTALSGIVYFHRADGQTIETHALPEGDWRNMGAPKEITVTVQPGDLLND